MSIFYGSCTCSLHIYYTHTTKILPKYRDEFIKTKEASCFNLISNELHQWVVVPSKNYKRRNRLIIRLQFTGSNMMLIFMPFFFFFDFHALIHLGLTNSILLTEKTDCAWTPTVRWLSVSKAVLMRTGRPFQKISMVKWVQKTQWAIDIYSLWTNAWYC